MKEKIYTEGQMKEAIRIAESGNNLQQIYTILNSPIIFDVMTDDEIEKSARTVMSFSPQLEFYNQGKIVGMKKYRDDILKQLNRNK